MAVYYGSAEGNVTIGGYGTIARVIPAYLALAPAGVLAAALFPAEAPWWARLGSAGVMLAPIAFTLGQIVADLGKRREAGLWKSWGGPPLASALRHSSGRVNPVTLTRLHEGLRSSGFKIPTEAEQVDDTENANTYFEACAEELIRRSRDRSAFPLVHQALTEYGFRRNLLGAKPFGLAVAIVVVLVSAWLMPVSPETGVVGRPELWVSGGSAATAMAFWIGWVRAETVRLAADRYTRAVLECARP